MTGNNTTNEASGTVRVVLPYTHGVIAGGYVQVKRTAEELRNIGVDVELHTATSGLRSNDIVHFFGPSIEFTNAAVNAHNLGYPVVVTSILCSRRPAWQWRAWGMLDRFVPVETVYSLRKRLLNVADVIVVCSSSEERWLRSAFPNVESQVRTVPIGLDVDRFKKATSRLFRQEYSVGEFVLQVSRINPIKGQLRSIRALEGMDIELVFVGGSDGNYKDYYEEFKDMVEDRDWVHYLGELNYESELLPSAYAAAKAHLLPSEREVPGMVNLEAAAAGLPVVTGEYPALDDYIGKFIYKCDPKTHNSIKRAVEKALERGAPPQQQEYVVDKLSWDAVARKLVSVYGELI